MADFFQKNLFLKWMEQNKSSFSHSPYLLQEGERHFTVGFRGVTKQIACCFFEKGAIEICVFYLKTLFDTLTNFDLYEEQTPEGSWVCILCLDCPNPENPESLIEYARREELWIKHSFEPLAAWTHTAFTSDAWLCFSRSGGAAWASIAREADLKKLENQPDFFKKVPMLLAKEGNGRRKA